jgi:hypothetical protein
LAQLMADIVQQCGLRDFGKSLGLALKPTSEVQQVIGVGAQGARRELTEMLGIEEIIGPGNLVVGIVEQAIRTGSGGSAGDEVAVRIVPVWQLDDVGAYADPLEALGELVGTLLPGLVVVPIESDVDRTARLLGKLRQLSGR